MAQNPVAPALQLLIYKALQVVLDEDRSIQMFGIEDVISVTQSWNQSWRTVPQPTSVTGRSCPMKVSDSKAEHVLLVQKADNILKNTEQ